MARRLNLSVSDELRERMEPYKTAVNWSAVAAEAFRRKLDELDRKNQEISNMEEAVARLRASKIESQHEDVERGHQAGREWAMKEAEWVNLVKLHEEFGDWDDEDWWGLFSTDDAIGFQGVFFRTLFSDEYSDRDAIEQFWESCGAPEPYPCEGFVRGFADGALEVFDEVKDQV